VNGNPAISYYDNTNYNLKFLRADDVSGVAWPVAAVVDTGVQSGTVGQYSSQAIVNGNPAISYYDASSGDLKYIRATDANGTNWGTPVTLDSSGDVGRFTSLVVVNGCPAISYYDATNATNVTKRDLKYVRAADASGTSWGTPVTLDSTGIVGQYTSMAIVNGNPAISYYDSTNTELKYVRAGDVSGTSWGTPTTVTTVSASTVGQYTSMVVVNGNPAISYYDSTSGDLKYVRASDTNGSSWTSPLTLDFSGQVGTFTSMALINGNPAVSYFDESNGDLKYVRASDVSGTSWGTPKTVISPGIVGKYTSMMAISGKPAIAYYDDDNGDLKYVKAIDAGGTDWGTPVTVDSSGLVGQYASLVVVNGNPAISYFDVSNGNQKWASLIYGEDADADGLLDSWELAFWSAISGHGPLDDEDHDDIVNLLEFAFGLNPTVNNGSALPAPVAEGGYLTLTITKQPGITYEIQSTGSLPGSFSSANTITLLNDVSTLKVRDNVLMSVPGVRFMRVQVTVTQ
jgi:hypothetical protein